MWKFKLFIFLEALLLGAALVTIAAGSVSRMLFFTLSFLLLIYYVREADTNNIWLLAVFLFFVLLSSFNPFLLLALILLLAFSFLLFLEQIRAVSQTLDKDSWGNQLFGDYEETPKSNQTFRDINSIHLLGSDVIDLRDCILTRDSHVIQISKALGSTRIILPLEVEVELNVSTIYGKVKFLDQEEVYLRSQGRIFETAHYQETSKSLKIVLCHLAGDVEVLRS